MSWQSPNKLNPVPTCGLVEDLTENIPDYQVINYNFWIYLQDNGLPLFLSDRPTIQLINESYVNLFLTLLHNFYGI